MNLFQVFVLVVLAVLVLWTAVAASRRWITRRAALGLGLVWFAAAVVALWPEVTTRAADVFGIGRGVDLVFYCAILLMMAGFLFMYIRLRRLRQNITVLVRRLAIMEAERRLEG